MSKFSYAATNARAMTLTFSGKTAELKVKSMSPKPYHLFKTVLMMEIQLLALDTGGLQTKVEEYIKDIKSSSGLATEYSQPTST